MARSWDRLVREGSLLVRDLQANKFALGDRALEVAPMSPHGVHSGAYGTLAEYAEAIGLESGTLESYRKVSAAWPDGTRVPSVSWSIYRELIRDGKGDTKKLSELVALARKQKVQVTVDFARTHSGRLPSRYPPPARTREEKIRTILDLLTDPEIASEVVEDDQTLRSISKAIRERSQIVPERRERGSANDPEMWTEAQWEEFDKEVMAASRTLLTAFNAWQRGIYKPSIAALAQLSLLKPQDLDAELSALIGS